MPRNGEAETAVEGLDEAADAGAARHFAAVRLALARIEAGAGTLAELEKALADEGAAGRGTLI